MRTRISDDPDKPPPENIQRHQSKEREAMNAWSTDHPGLIVKEPFRYIADMIHNILEDGTIDEELHEEILERCWMYDDDSRVMDVSDVDNPVSLQHA